jgi:hypothetical protein
MPPKAPKESTDIELGKDRPVRITAPQGLIIVLLGTLIIVGWNARGALEAILTRLSNIETIATSAWTYSMERESWSEFKSNNPGIIIPNTTAIREAQRTAAADIPYRNNDLADRRRAEIRPDLPAAPNKATQ